MRDDDFADRELSLLLLFTVNKTITRECGTAVKE